MRVTNRSRGLVSLVTMALSAGCMPEPPGGELVSEGANGMISLMTVPARKATPVIHGYEDAPRAPNSDDPAIWVNPRNSGESLVIGTLKEGGMQVYKVDGTLVQTVLPPYRRPVTAADPPVAGAQPEPGTSACPGSASGKVVSRFNNVDVQYDFGLRGPSGKKKIDIAVVSDEGCDLVWVYGIDPTRSDGPLYNLTAMGVERIFPERFAQPSPLQPSTGGAGVQANPLDDENTAYGLGLYRDKTDTFHVFVTQAHRSVLAELELTATAEGRVSYRRVREYRFDAFFRIRNAAGGAPIKWTPCREEADRDPQFEGLVVDQERGILYASQEQLGIWKIRLSAGLPRVFNVPQNKLIEPVTSFGAPYWAVPDEDEFECSTKAPVDEAGQLPEGTIFAPGNRAVGGKHLVPDSEGLAMYYGAAGDGYLIVSSQGDNTLQVYQRAGHNRHVGSFRVEGVGETDGHDVVNVPIGRHFGKGLFVTQNGAAPGPADTSSINGYEYDNSTQFVLVGWEEIAKSLHLDSDTKSYDPRNPHG